MTNLAIEARGLRKSFGDLVVLDGIDLALAEGSVFALIGPNGSGKTTTVWVLSTILPADAGMVRVAGHDVSKEPGSVRRAIGVTGQFSAVDNLLKRFDLVPAAGRPVVTYSGGMRRRLDLAMTLVGEPRVIFLDEPTTGLDPRSRRTMWEIVRELSASGVTIFLTTQYLEEADQLADRIAVLDHGRLVGEGTPAELKRVIPGGHVELHLSDAAALDMAARIIGAENMTQDKEALVVRVPTDGSLSTLRTLLDRLDDHSAAVESVSVHTADLDDVFFALTGRSDTAAHAVEEGER